METVSFQEFEATVARHNLPHHAVSWLHKALHPASAVTDVCIPDLSRTPSAHMDFRPSVVVSAPDGLEPDDTWDCLIWTPPGDVTAAVIVYGPAGTDFNTGGTIARVLNCQTSALGTSIGYQKLYGSSGSLPANFQAQPRYPSSLPYEVRTTYRSVTASLTASALNNQGTVYSTQLARDIRPSGYAWNYSSSPWLVGSVYWTYVPFDENALNLLSPATITRPAKEGVYMPQRMTGPEQPFVSQRFTGLDLLGVNNEDSPGVYSTGAYWSLNPLLLVGGGLAEYSNSIGAFPVPITQPASGVKMPSWVHAANGAGYSDYFTALAVPNTGFDNVTQGVTIFRGLSPAASLTIQTYVGLEIVPRQDSPIRSFVRVPEVPCLKALDLYYDLANTMPVSYPARYNSTGALLPLIINALKYIGPRVPAIIDTVASAVRAIRAQPKAQVAKKSKKSVQKKK